MTVGEWFALLWLAIVLLVIGPLTAEFIGWCIRHWRTAIRHLKEQK